MKIHIEIETNNDQMSRSIHVAAALQDVMAKILAEPTRLAPTAPVPILDLNGNTVGQWQVVA